MKEIIVFKYNDYNRCDEEEYYYEKNAQCFKDCLNYLKQHISEAYHDAYERLLLPYEENDNGGFRWNKEPTYENLLKYRYIDLDDCNDIYYYIRIEKLNSSNNVEVE